MIIESKIFIVYRAAKGIRQGRVYSYHNRGYLKVGQDFIPIRKIGKEKLIGYTGILNWLEFYTKAEVGFDACIPTFEDQHLVLTPGDLE